MSATAEVLSETLDNIDQTLEILETTPEIIRRNKLVTLVIVVSAFAAGAGAATLVSRRYFKLHYEEIAEREIEEAKTFYKTIHKADEWSDPAVLAEELGLTPRTGQETSPHEPITVVDKEIGLQIVKEQGYAAYDQVTPSSKAEKIAVKAEEVTVEVTPPQSDDGIQLLNIFTVEGDDYDQAVEDAKAFQGQPYIIQAEDFFENDKDHTQLSFTFFELDQVMADEADRMVRDYDRDLGSDNLHFGRGSNDSTRVYIRNDQKQTDWEVSLSQNGSYREEVLGEELDGELRHSAHPPLRKFRNDFE